MGNWSDYILKLFQSTLPRRERRHVIVHECNGILISIHTPTKGATGMDLTYPCYTQISIHTPTKGATGDATGLDKALSDFNPHSHEGSDYDQLVKLYTYAYISIHTPTKGATNTDKRKLRRLENFNPHSHEGSDGRRFGTCRGQYRISIHTPTKGATKIKLNTKYQGQISIHTPTKGAT